ncbi:MAG: lysophospholipid transporter LplT [Candidatus Accumulibacter sp.]|jgi:MFS family permease|nr:lysophospholipid transporter LplT [Accumulibacter sp.]
MPLGFYIIMAAQFFSALADNALLIVAIAALRAMDTPPAYEPLLKTFFSLSYVLLAVFVGAFADSMPKGRVMFISNAIKIAGCVMMFFGAHPLAAYAVVGLGAAAYSPAKYGILTEYLPHRMLVVANGWIEGLTVVAIILGVVVGSCLIQPLIVERFLDFTDLDDITTDIDISLGATTVALVCFFYILAAFFNIFIPKTGAPNKPLHSKIFSEFSQCFALLWRDRLGQISLAVTTLFWGAGATLQFIVIQWSETMLNLDLSQSGMLQGVVAIGVAVGAAGAAKTISMRKSISVIPLGIAMGIVVLIMNFVTTRALAVPLLIVIGALSGYFVVPMNALLQHRGHSLMGAGNSIAIQNFNENLSILVMTGMYYMMVNANLSTYAVITTFGLFVSISMLLVKFRHEANQRIHDDVSLLDDSHLH